MILKKTNNMSIKVGDDYRTNELSFIPGGSEVEAVSKNGKKKIYDKIKMVDKYCNRLKGDQSIIEIYVNGKLYWKRNP
ncbi:MAG: hypothetical protein EBS34_13480 [Flavobacteriales bacterium]|nr:hypothetical protein [Flavobacteriales bacterium]